LAGPSAWRLEAAKAWFGRRKLMEASAKSTTLAVREGDLIAILSKLVVW
jgi:hypothetical protein